MFCNVPDVFGVHGGMHMYNHIHTHTHTHTHTYTHTHTLNMPNPQLISQSNGFVLIFPIFPPQKLKKPSMFIWPPKPYRT